MNRLEVGWFSSLANAVQAMKKDIEKEKKYERQLFGFLIVEFELDKDTYMHSKSIRNYLPDGSLWDECLVSSTFTDDGNFEEFLGRPADKLRFCIGDLVEVLYGDTVTLEIVGATPWSPEKVSEFKSKNAKRGFTFSLDSSDDCYYTLWISENDDDDTHHHPSPVTLFPLRFPVSNELRSNLEKQYKRYRTHFEK